MLACPSCPAPASGAPFIQLDHRVACWATQTLSAAGLRAWLRLLTHFRNDRPIPQLSARRLAQIAGLSVGAAHKVLKELRQVLVFAQEEPEQPAKAAAAAPDGGCSRHERGVHEMNARCSPHERKRSRHERGCSRRERPTISVQEENQEEEKNPPPTSSVMPAGRPGAVPGEEAGRGAGPGVSAGVPATSHRGGSLDPSRGAEPNQGPAPQLDSRLRPVAQELEAYWAGKRGSRTPLAFAAQQAQLLQILASPIGGIEEVRGQIAAAAMKDWDFIRYQTWHDWRQKHPPPLLLEESDLNPGALFPGLKAFERRYRATYGQHSSSADVLVAFRNYSARSEYEGSLSNLDQP